MTSHELEADNIVLIAIAERNILVMQRSRALLKSVLLDDSAGALANSMRENIFKIEDSIKRSREFLEKLYSECSYPIQQ